MARIFVLAATADMGFAKPLASALTGFGHTVTFLDGMGDLSLGVKSAVSNSDALIPILGTETVASQNFISAIGFALGYRTRFPNFLLFPVFRAPAQKIPLAIASLEGIFAEERTPEEVAETINAELQRITGTKAAEEQERKQASEKIERSAPKFIELSRKRLERRETTNLGFALAFYLLSGLSLLGAIAFIWFRTVSVQHAGSTLDLIEILAFGFLGTALIVALAKFFFSLAKGFMVESIRNADRSHAISFGEFYLHAFSDRVQWAEVKEAFQQWNVGSSSFLAQSSTEFDPAFIDKFMDLVKHLTPRDGPKGPTNPPS